MYLKCIVVATLSFTVLQMLEKSGAWNKRYPERFGWQRETQGRHTAGALSKETSPKGSLRGWET